MDVTRFVVELEPEVRRWLAELPARHYVKAEDYVDLLADNPTLLGEPYSRHLGGAVRELRFSLGREATRITYWLAPDRRVVLLTVFVKTKMRETVEVTRALWAQKICEAEHGEAHEEFSRSITDEETR
ncbi:hypothetical protein ABH930_003916 [Kitasatospora sp. GAS204A]|uniref:type II toxin-antitoxin system RelE/ParE family toxin n=1 Tax=unclassified Kitasatospora TaxID=2633591 RepID=UPI002475801F|nr:type II toxin-antitoxin system RelE/ParE family toxin [Kitasatospora sp. GAS204B]MDH6120641.1 hypothetical protein [Kitasatospora sp. GAS204B]